jgi:hypothetical protein
VQAGELRESASSLFKNDIYNARLKRLQPWIHHWINVTGFGKLKPDETQMAIKENTWFFAPQGLAVPRLRM